MPMSSRPGDLALFSFQGLWSVGSTPYIYREEMKIHDLRP